MTDPKRLKKGVLILLAYCAIFFVPYYTTLLIQIYQHWTK